MQIWTKQAGSSVKPETPIAALLQFPAKTIDAEGHDFMALARPGNAAGNYPVLLP